MGRRGDAEMEGYIQRNNRMEIAEIRRQTQKIEKRRWGEYKYRKAQST
jgi:hypothetical protein